MPQISLTTLARVKARKSLPDSADAWITNAIPEVSQEFEKYLGRHTLQTSYNEVYVVPFHSRIIHLKGAPVITFSSLKVEGKRSNFAAATAVDTDLYDVDFATGIIELFATQTRSPGFAQTIYTGGMAVDTTAFIAAFPDIAGAADREIINRWNRRDNPTGAASGKAGAVRYFGGSTLLADSRRVLNQYRRTHF